jgi:hypothetical protein
LCKHFSSALPQLPASASPLPHPWSSGSAGRPLRPARGRAGPQPAPGRMGGDVPGPGPGDARVGPGSSGDVATGDGGRGAQPPGLWGVWAPPTLSSLAGVSCLFVRVACGGLNARPMDGGLMARGGRSPWPAQCGLLACWARALSFYSKRCAGTGCPRAAGFVAGWSPGVNELGSPGGS